MRTIYSVFLVFLIVQIICLGNPKIWAEEGDLAETKGKVETQRILRLRIEMKTERVKEILHTMGLKCEWGKDEAVCNATVHQMSQLKQAGIEFEVQREGIEIKKGALDHKRMDRGKGSAYDDNENNYTIPEGDWNHSPITITSAPPTATVTTIDVYYEVIHTYIGDLVIKLTDQDLGHEWTLWYYEGGSGDNIQEAEWDITEFNGELVNQTWKLWGYDCCAGDDGYIDYWSIQIWYEDLPDLIVQSLTASDYNPNVGDYIDVTVVIKNQGSGSASSFYNGLYYDLSSPPDIYTIEDDWWWTSYLDADSTESHTFYNITSSEPGTWYMYGLADCDGYITESNENNNYKGPVTINWTSPPPDLIVQSLTVEDASLIITEHTNGTITIKNESSVPVTETFRTDVFKNEDYAPFPPASGQYRWEEYSLNPGATRTYNFYKLPHSTSAGTWKMWGLVDSQGDIAESDDYNNAYGPLNIIWSDPPWPPDEVTRATMIDHGLEFVNVNWTCSSDNVDSHWSCPSWTCAFSPGQYDTGEAYSYGGWDKPDDFLAYLSAGLCAGSLPGNNCGQADAYWATGTDCSGLVSRCWELPSRRTTSSLVYVSDQITVSELQPGDIMNNPGVHVMMFYQWVIEDSLIRVIEATPPQACTSRYSTDDLVGEGYVPRRYDYVYDPGQQDPEIVGHIHCKYPEDECGDCVKYGEQITIELDAYDPDGDSIYYEWYSYWGWFIVDGETTYWDTTAQNFITYLAPSFCPPGYDELSVTVHDVRGGWASIEGQLGIYAEETSCICGDVNGTGTVDLSDAAYIIGYLFLGYPPPPEPIERADPNNDCSPADLSDAQYIVNYLFNYGPPPVCCWIRPPEEFTESF